LGLHRVLEPEGVLPQAALRLDASLPLYEGEILLRVERLHVDSASFRQLKESCGDDAAKIAARIQAIVAERGKLENPVTGSGGMLIGRIEDSAAPAPIFGKIGDKVATLVSLTLTPLHLEAITQVDLATGQVEARGHAILFASGTAAPLPADLPEETALSVLDVCGAPAWVRKLAQPDDRVLIVGAGKSGILSAFAAREAVDPKRLWLTDVREAALERASALKVAENVVLANAQQPVRFLDALRAAGAPAFDLVINTSNAPETEAACILAAREGGRILFFNMATSFSRAVLTAEGVGREATLIMGNGYAKGHWQYALDLVRKHQPLKRFFEWKT
jgi:L-erythro-3,5-diaminohexanoate dehydrogenase